MRVLVSPLVRGSESPAHCLHPFPLLLQDTGARVLVLGATGGVGQIVTAKLLERGFQVRALVRNASKARASLGPMPNLELVEGDCRFAEQVDRPEASKHPRRRHGRMTPLSLPCTLFADL